MTGAGAISEEQFERVVEELEVSYRWRRDFSRRRRV